MSTSDVSIPLLSPHARVVGTREAVSVVTPFADYRYTGRGGEILGQIVYRLDGSATLGEIRARIQASPEQFAAVLRPLFTDQVLVDLAPAVHASTPEEYLNRYFAICDAWAALIFDLEFWTAVVSGDAPRAVILGWGIEFYHRVIGSNEHNSVAVNYCADPVARAWLDDHFIEEVEHGEMFLGGLERCGVDATAVRNASPLPSTQGLVTALSMLAMANTWAFLGCYGVMHSPRGGHTASAIHAQFDRLDRLYPFAKDMLDQFRQHELIDVELGHEELILERMCARDGVPDARNAVRPILAAKGMVQAFVGFFDGIYAHYSAGEHTIPWSSR
jgi:pyrroloquinoline quinone (PQQ) biosynthesis protein C